MNWSSGALDLFCCIFSFLEEGSLYLSRFRAKKAIFLPRWNGCFRTIAFFLTLARSFQKGKVPLSTASEAVPYFLHFFFFFFCGVLRCWTFRCLVTFHGLCTEIHSFCNKILKWLAVCNRVVLFEEWLPVLSEHSMVLVASKITCNCITNFSDSCITIHIAQLCQLHYTSCTKLLANLFAIMLSEMWAFWIQKRLQST